MRRRRHITAPRASSEALSSGQKPNDNPVVTEVAFSGRIDAIAAAFDRRVVQGDGCWRWMGSFNDGGYGQLTVRTSAGVTTIRAHRLAYELFVAPIPSGFELDHLCSNRWCVNPEHLEPVTHAENVRRATARPTPIRYVDFPVGPSDPDRMGDGATRVLLALVIGNRTITDIATATGHSRSTVHGHLRRLRDAGLVHWTPGTQGSLHALVESVPLLALAGPSGEG